jgi:hypothetical protein
MRRALVVVAVALALAGVLIWLRPGRPADGGLSATAPRPSIRRHAAPPLLLRDGGAGRVGVVWRAAWGSGAGQLGRGADSHSVTAGPMSLLADKHGLVVLDNVNQRLVRLDAQGRPLPPIALPNGAAQDVARGAGERLAVLDRLRAGKVTLLDGDGRTIGVAALAGPGIAEPAAVSGIFGDRDGAIVAEIKPGAWIDLFDAAGTPSPRRAHVPGRPTRDGGYVSAAVVNRAAGSVLVHRFSADGSPRWDAIVLFGAPLIYIALLDSDAAGNVFLGVHTARQSPTQPSPSGLVDETLRVAAIVDDGDGGRIEPEQLSVDAPPPREEGFRDLSVGDDGTIYWMRRTPDGVVIEAYRL